jgi:hypothetical protein
MMAVVAWRCGIQSDCLEPDMTRRSRRVGPFLEEFDNKTLWSADGTGHLAGAPYLAVDDVAAKFKFDFATKRTEEILLLAVVRPKHDGPRRVVFCCYLTGLITVAIVAIARRTLFRFHNCFRPLFRPCSNLRIILNWHENHA